VHQALKHLSLNRIKPGIAQPRTDATDALAENRVIKSRVTSRRAQILTRGQLSDASNMSWSDDRTTALHRF
jgi:hypothetical protein